VALCEKSHKRNFVECELSVPQLRCLQEGGRSPGVNACNTCSCKTTFIKGIVQWKSLSFVSPDRT